MSLVPAASFALSGYNLAKRVRLTDQLVRNAALAAPYLRRYGPGTLKAVKRMGRMSLRRYRSRYRTRSQRMKIGEQVGQGGIKRNQTANFVANRSTRLQNIREMLEIAKTTNTGDITQRQRDIINFRGFKGCIEIKNLLDSPLMFNYAVVVRNDQFDTNVFGFFRNDGRSSDRELDFSNTLSSNDFHCLPINTDKYHVLKHKRFIIGAAATTNGFTTNSRENYRTLNFYHRVKRQFRYKGNSENDLAADNIEVVWWCDRMLNPAGALSEIDACQVHERYVSYFREPKN